MAKREYLTHSTEETIARGRSIGSQLKPPVLILLWGDLGAGKTTLTKGIVDGVGAVRAEEVTSPTFTLVHKYGQGAPVYHVDLYRITDFNDLETLGLEDVLSEPGIVLVEWPDRLILRTDWPILRIFLEHVSEDERRISIEDDSSLLAEF